MGVGTWPDWIIAVANVVMAGAALYAALNAKDWLSPSLRNKGFDLAVELRNSIYPKLMKNLELNYLDYNNLHGYFIRIESEINSSKKAFINFSSFQLFVNNSSSSYIIDDQYEENLLNLISIKSEMNKKIEDLEVFGWILKNKGDFEKLKISLTNYAKNVEGIHNEIRALIKYIDDLQSQQFEIEDLPRIDEKYNLLKNKINLTSYEDGKKKIIDELNAFYSYKSVQDPFDIK
ncbi:hypothetical protein [Pectobacterium versatile]|uniref:hypothetical protein n=1 Tax=Pectobacterium versatile TaxID=2488639 RepID=UPI00382D282F